MILSDKQKKAFDIYRKGENMFLTGCAGTGKTALIRQIYKDAELRKVKVKVTALTGCAAILLGCKARTIHSYSGIGIGSGTIDENIARVKRNLGKLSSWRSTQLLIIDEVSMMSKKLLNILDAVARAVRKQPDLPFGGIQLIFSGDFFQIRPVPDDRDPDTGSFCFESPLWGTLFKKENHVKLTQIFRQKDPEYTEILNAIREGSVEQRHIDTMKGRVRSNDNNKNDNDIVKPTKLFPTRRQVDYVNQAELEKLPTDPEHIYSLIENLDLPMTPQEMKRRTKVSAEEIQRELVYLRRNLMCDEDLRLRKGAQVMCVVNKEMPDKEYLCNGSQGVVVGFEAKTNLPIVRFRSGLETVMTPHTWASEFVPGVGLSQIPLIICYACSIHKMQGATMDTAEINVGKNVFECGQTYVALSRLKTLEGLFLTDFDPSKIFVDEKVVSFYKTFD
jgi:ATP-dependent DNA helicase PIF1